MIVLRRSMQGEDVFEHTKGKRHVFAVSMQEEDIIEHSNPKCHSFVYTLVNS